MTQPTRVLVIGAGPDEIAALVAVVNNIFSTRCHLLGMELDTSSVNPTLAWGTEGPRVVELTPTTTEPSGEVVQEQPLPEDGDTWKAIAAAAGRFNVDLVAAVHKRQNWFSRVLSGSAARDLVDNTDWPVLLIAPEALRRSSTDRPGPSTPLSSGDGTIGGRTRPR